MSNCHFFFFSDFEALITASVWSFARLVTNEQADLDITQNVSPSESARTPYPDPFLPGETSDCYLIRQLQKGNYEMERGNCVRLQDILPLLENCTANLRTACTDSISAAETTLERINEC